MSETERVVLRMGARCHMAAKIVPGLRDRHRLQLTDFNGDAAVPVAYLGTTVRGELMVRCQADIQRLLGDAGRERTGK